MDLLVHHAIGQHVLCRQQAHKVPPPTRHTHMTHHHTQNQYAKKKKRFLLHSNHQLVENRHVMCVVEKDRFEPRTLGTRVERATNCTTAPVRNQYAYFLRWYMHTCISYRCETLKSSVIYYQTSVYTNIQRENPTISGEI